MIVLGIETSCDETALSIIESPNDTDIHVLADKTLSQIELHRQYGGVFPNMAKREHSRNLIPLLKTVLEESNFLELGSKNYELGKDSKLNAILEREPELLEQFQTFIPTITKPPIDVIATTVGPGLEPCLWTGLNLAKALSLVWNIPVVPVNHMEGHIFSARLHAEENPKSEIRNPKQFQNPKSQIKKESPKSYKLKAISYPALALLISGGHTELVLIKKEGDYDIIGQTRDDAVGEAFDKVARLLGLPYPGGPEISALAEKLRSRNYELREEGEIKLPRPMLHSGDFDFSFSGIKTAVLYLIRKLPALTDDTEKEIAREFEDAVTEVLVAKTKKAVTEHGAQTLLIGGGVIANTHIRKEFERLASALAIPLHIPEPSLTTDNALMIAVVGLIRSTRVVHQSKEVQLKAQGNLRL